MANSKLLLAFSLHLVLALFVFDLANAQGLKLEFYKKSCPSAEYIIKKTTKDFISRAPTLAAPLLRMHFHDCFVRGCDGSVLLNSTSSNQAEKDAIPNQTLRGYQVIDAAKAALEKACPGVVSCADIVALVARDAVLEINGPFWSVPTGRRDGRVSIASEALTNLPAPFFNITQLIASFASKGLSVKDLVVLSGGHTIGIGHCTSFTNRLYNFTGRGDTDPSMDQNYIANLKNRCKPGDTTTFVQMDPGSSQKFDSSYYTVVGKRRGLFQSDAALLDDSTTRAYVQLSSNPSGSSTFLNDFEESMVKMGNIGVLTGSSGEIRKQCSRIN
ncbi:Peroxidase [Actinidia chinensis var. chinensis]|uniref:Peroxidase n=1 Tax=Actinidia chinensis var. chinensis TaxID=1590841 RepID=A0A2R6QTG9_ACTCC|nr:Peroxidase [Actinidia chinensis var. chinensis]